MGQIDRWRDTETGCVCTGKFKREHDCGPCKQDKIKQTLFKEK